MQKGSSKQNSGKKNGGKQGAKKAKPKKKAATQSSGKKKQQPQKTSAKSKKSGSLCGSLCGAGLVLTFVYLVIAIYTGYKVCTRSSNEFTSIPPLVAEHIGEGSYVPIHDGQQSIRVFVRKSGDLRGDEELALLVHGVPSSSFSYRRVIDALTARGIASVAFDFPGMGLSDKPSQAAYTWEYLAASIKQVLDDTHSESVHLVLHDIGIPVGLSFAAVHPQLVDSITFLNGPTDLGRFTPPFPMNLLADEMIGPYAMYALASPLMSPITKMMMQLSGASSFTQEVVDAYLYLLTYQQGAQSFLKIMRGFNATKANSVRLWDEFAVPFCNAAEGARCQLVEIDEDSLPSLHERYAARQLGSGCKRGPRIHSRHFVSEDKPQQVAARIASFIGGLPDAHRQRKVARQVREPQYEQVDAGSKYAMHDHSHGAHGHEGHHDHAHSH